MDLDANAHQFDSFPMLTAELPKPTAHISPFKADPEFARQAAYKAHKTAADLKEDGERFRALVLEQAKQPTPKPIESTAALLEAERQLSLTEELIEHARERLKTCDDKAASGLIREIRSLQEHRCRLLNIAQAPTSKAQPARTRVTPQPVSYSLPTVAPTDASASNSNGA